MIPDTGLPAIAPPSARLLILGSMPGRESLCRREYYAHPRNAFWFVMGELFGASPSLPYAERVATLEERGVALWDVAHACVRPGSLDSSIRDVVPNDFASLFERCPDIGAIFFNGAKSRELFARFVQPELAAPGRDLPRTRLPSTSPAYAGMKREEKLRIWREALADLASVRT